MAEAGGRLSAPAAARRDLGLAVVTAVLACLTLAGLLVRFYRLDVQNFWLDELWTAAASDPAQPLGEWLAEWILPDVHPPLYYLIIRAWRELFGASELALRLPSTLFGLLAVAVVPLVQRWTPFVRRPWALAALLATATGAILYAQEARAYTLLIFLTTAATCLGVAMARRIEAGQPISGPALLLAGITVAFEYVHYFGALVGAGTFGALFLFALMRGNRRAAGVVLVAGAVSILLFLPWVAFHVPRIADKTGGHFWITNDWAAAFRAFAGFTAGTAAVFVGLAGVAASILVRRPRVIGRPDYFVPLVAMALMLAAAIAISLHTPLITARNLLILMPAFYIFTVTALADLEELAQGMGRTLLRLAPALVAAVSLGFAVHQVGTDTKDKWRDAAAFIASIPGCETGVLAVNQWPQEVYAYYLPPSHRARLVEVDAHQAGRPPVSPFQLTGQSCPLLLWAGNIGGDAVVNAWLDKLGLEREAVLVERLPGHVIVLRREQAAA